MAKKRKKRYRCLACGQSVKRVQAVTRSRGHGTNICISCCRLKGDRLEDAIEELFCINRDAQLLALMEEVRLAHKPGRGYH